MRLDPSPGCGRAGWGTPVVRARGSACSPNEVGFLIQIDVIPRFLRGLGKAILYPAVG